jgi:hypothetical protein
MNTTDKSTEQFGIWPEKFDPETESIILEKLSSFDEDTKTSVDAREGLIGIRRKLRNAPAPAR